MAVGVGSRGIANLAATVRAVATHLRAAGVEPFIIPAMRSHGGATAEGQIQVLSHLGVTEETVGAPVVVRLSGDAIPPLRAAAREVIRLVEGSPAVDLVYDDYGPDVPRVAVDVDRVRASRLQCR